MADITELLWQQFGVETQEHLDALDNLLGDLDVTAVDGEQIGALFRGFHSLKGLAAAMGMTGMEALSHSAESALSPVRDGSATLNPPLAGLLVHAVDTLRAMQERAVAERADSPEPEKLVAKLLSLPGPHGRPATGSIAAVESDEDPNPRSSDDDLAGFTDLVLATMTALVGAMTTTSSTDSMRALDDDLIKLDELAGELGLHGFRRRVRALSRAVHRDGPTIGLLRDTAVSLATLEELTGRAAGRHVLLEMVAQRGAGDIGRLGAKAAALLSGEARDDAEPDALVATMEAIADHADLLELPRSGRIARLCVDVLRRGALVDSLKAIMMDAADAISASVATDPPGDMIESRADALIAALRDATGGLVDPVLGDRLQALGVDMALLSLLPGDASERLRSAADDPKTQLVELDAHLENDSDFAEQLATWIAGHGELIGSRIVDIDGEPATRLLIAVQIGEEEFAAALASIDPAHTLTTFHICDGRERPVRNRQADTRKSEQVVRVAGQALDSFMTRIGELIRIQAGFEDMVADSSLPQAMTAMLRRARDAGLAGDDLQPLFEQWNGRLRLLSEDLDRTLKLLQADALDLRVVPVDALLQRFPRIARDLARRHDKDVRVVLEGRDARIDKGMVDILTDPLTHMVRNAVDHGIELPQDRVAMGKPDQATITLAAEQQGDRILIEVADDGRGIDLDRVRRRAGEVGLASAEILADMSDDDVGRLIFAPGFSTAEKVTETSGRGVGMDVVDRAITRLGGAIRVRTTAGKGTKFTMDLPLSAAIQSTILVQQGEQVFAIPERFVHEVFGVDKLDERARDSQDAPLPMVGLGDLLRIPVSRQLNGQRRVVVLAVGRRRLGLSVDRVVNRRDIYVKESHPGIASVPGIGGVTTLGDGRVVLILDPDGLMRLAFDAKSAAPR